MILWLVSLLAGIAFATLSYGVSVDREKRRAMFLRALAAAAVVAYLIGAPLGRERQVRPWVALDISASWLADGDTSRWLAALDSARFLLGGKADSLILFGEEPRGGNDTLPSDRRSAVRPVIESVLPIGRPVIVITDGLLEDAQWLERLPEGSRAIVLAADSREDAAVARLEVPDAAVAGDTVDVRVVVRAGAAGSRERVLSMNRTGVGAGASAAGGSDAATQIGFAVSTQIGPLGPFEEREWRVQLPIPSATGDLRVVVQLDSADAVRLNDMAEAIISVSGEGAAVLVSTSPDHDSRYALALLRQTRRSGVRAYWMVAPGVWRVDGSQQSVAESVVREAVGGASMLFVHGDTSYFGPRQRTRATGVVLMPPPERGDDYYPTGAGESPLAPVLAGVPWDSLSPIDVSPRSGTFDYTGVTARRARRLDERTVVGLRDGNPRVAVVSASGLWRWKMRGGRQSEVFDAVWGSIFDWVSNAERPLAGVTGQSAAVSDPVNQEYVPRQVTVVSGSVGDGLAGSRKASARDAAWLLALALMALCAEWFLRRRIGLR